jgi:hypothetical protein
MMTNPRDTNVVAEIKKRYGNVIDLDKSPMAIIEIIHNFRYLLDEVAGPDGTAGGPGGPSPPPTAPSATWMDWNVEEVGTATVLNLLLELRREVQALQAKIK